MKGTEEFKQKAVHGDIRHLEIQIKLQRVMLFVHGDIRHLEICSLICRYRLRVHGDIRHLERT